MMATKRILHEIRLDRIAAVDRPCQQPALATIMKRAPAEPDGTGRRNIMRQFKIDEISAVDRPCQDHALAVIFKRGAEPPAPGLESIQAPNGIDWPKRRADALAALQAKAEARAAAKGEPVAKAYVDLLDTEEGRELYASAV